MATLPLKASCKEERSVIHFLWAKRRCPNTIHSESEMRPVYGDKCFKDQQYMFGVRSLLVDKKELLMKKDLADVLFQRLIQRSQQWHLSYGLTRMYR